MKISNKKNPIILGQRDPEVLEAYKKFKKENPKYCPFSDRDRLIQEWEHWMMLENAYPHLGADNHRMLAPKRHIKFMKELNVKEILELPEILSELDYVHLTMNAPKARTVPDYFHLHLF